MGLHRVRGIQIVDALGMFRFQRQHLKKAPFHFSRPFINQHAIFMNKNRSSRPHITISEN